MKNQSPSQKTVRGIAVFITLLIIFNLEDKYGKSWANATRYLVWAAVTATSAYLVIRAVDHFYDTRSKTK